MQVVQVATPDLGRLKAAIMVYPREELLLVYLVDLEGVMYIQMVLQNHLMIVKKVIILCNIERTNGRIM